MLINRILFIAVTRVSQKFSNILCTNLQCVYHMIKVVQAVVGSIAVVGALTCALFPSVSDLNFAQMNVQYSQIQEIRLYHCQVNWGCRIHQLHLFREVKLPNECPGYDTKQADGEVPLMLEL